MTSSNGSIFRVTSLIHYWLVSLFPCGVTTPQWIRPNTWWRHQMEAFSALLAICARNSPVSGEFPVQWPVTRSFDVFFDLRLNEWLSKHSWGWWLETLSRPLWRHSNEMKACHSTELVFVSICSTRRKTNIYIRFSASIHFPLISCMHDLA